jgi:undecaprenyl-diphosphatase
VDSLIRLVGSYFFLISVVLVALYWFRANRQVKLSLTWQLLAGGVLALALDEVAGHLYYDPRPFVTHHLVPIIAHAADNGFPSDHALLTFFLAFTMLIYSRRLAAVLFLNAVLVSWARVAAHIHNPRDIVGSFLIAALAVAVSYGVAHLWRLRRARSARKP